MRQERRWMGWGWKRGGSARPFPAVIRSKEEQLPGSPRARQASEGLLYRATHSLGLPEGPMWVVRTNHANMKSGSQRLDRGAGQPLCLAGRIFVWIAARPAGRGTPVCSLPPGDRARDDTCLPGFCPNRLACFETVPSISGPCLASGRDFGVLRQAMSLDRF